MSDPELFKYDVRVRERMLKRAAITEADLEKHLASLPDVEAQSANIELVQPALGGAHPAIGSPTPSASPRGPVSDEDPEAT